MGELLTIGVGGTGCRIAESFWEMALSHHLQQPESSLPSTLFKDSKNARTVLVDYDAYDLNAIQKRMHQHINNQDCVSSYECTGGVYFRAKRFIEKSLVQPSMERIRKQIEACDCLQGIQLFHSISGGTGSGLYSVIGTQIAQEFGLKKKCINFTVFPTNRDVYGAEVYNTILGLNDLLEYSDLTILFQSAKVAKIIDKYAPQNTLQQQYVQNDVHAQVNCYVANCALHLAECLSDKTLSIAKILQNICPYPRLHFVQSSFAPLQNAVEAPLDLCHQLLGGQYQSLHLPNWEKNHYRIIASYMFFKAQKEIDLQQILCSLEHLRKSQAVRGVDWNPNSWSVLAQNNCNFVGYFNKNCKNWISRDKCALGLLNGMGIDELFSSISRLWDVLNSKRVFQHFFRDSGERHEMQEAREDIAALEKDYESWSVYSMDGRGEQSDMEDMDQ